MKRTFSAVTALLIFCLISVGLASAASLNLTGSKMSTVTAADRCTPSAKVTTGALTNSTTKSVELSGLTNKCRQKKVSLTLYNAQGIALSTVTEKNLGPVTGGKATVTLPASVAVTNMEGAALTIGTWGIPTTFVKPPNSLVSCSIPSRPDVTCSVSYTKTKLNSTNFEFNNLSLATSPVVAGAKYELLLNLSDPWFASTPNPLGQIRTLNGSELKLAPGTSCASRPNIRLVGKRSDNELTRANGTAGGFYLSGSTLVLAPTTSTLLSCP